MVNEIDDELVEMIPAEMAFPIGIDAGCLNLEGFISYLIHIIEAKNVVHSDVMLKHQGGRWRSFLNQLSATKTTEER